jgi:drug/metabolite transporter (DMT)-like permease
MHILEAWFPIIYVGVISGAIGFTFQIIAQKDTAPTIAALLMSFEAVFAALTGFIILNEILTIRELIGCVLMFIAVVAAQLPEKQAARE